MGSRLTDDQPLTNRLGGSALKTLLTSGETAIRRATQSVSSTSMRVLPRDHRVLSFVARFRQLSTAQIKALAFPETASRIPADRAIKRLLDAGLLDKVTQRHPSGSRGGSAPNIYQLGREGWSHFFTGKRKIQRTISYHALLVADVFIAVMQADRDGWLDLLEWHVEADAWAQVAGVELRPDLYLDLGLRDKRERIQLYVEVDLGTERQKQIAEKLDRYKYAYEHAEAFSGDVFPQVVFLCVSDDRVREMRSIAAKNDVPDGLVMIGLVDDFPTDLR